MLKSAEFKESIIIATRIMMIVRKKWYFRVFCNLAISKSCFLFWKCWTYNSTMWVKCNLNLFYFFICSHVLKTNVWYFLPANSSSYYLISCFLKTYKISYNYFKLSNIIKLMSIELFDLLDTKHHAEILYISSYFIFTTILSDSILISILLLKITKD